MADTTDELELEIELRFPSLALEVSETISLSGVTALFGPSGAGKSTLLRIIAGIERAASGKINYLRVPWLDSKAGVFVPPHRRAVAFVFQDTQLFPHLNVAGNLNFGYRRRKGQHGPNWAEVTKALDLGPLLDRDVSLLSGGERQRVALGRSLLAAPRLLLLDEPLAALDSERKAEIMPYLKCVISEFDLPIVYVTHSEFEVRSLASRVLALVNGKIVHHENSFWFARFSEHSYVRASVVSLERPGLVVCRVGENMVLAEMRGTDVVGSDVELAIERSNMLLFSGNGEDALGAGKLDAIVAGIDRAADGSGLEVIMRTSGGELVADVHHSSWTEPRLAVSERIQVILPKPATVSRIL